MYYRSGGIIIIVSLLMAAIGFWWLWRSRRKETFPKFLANIENSSGKTELMTNISNFISSFREHIDIISNISFGQNTKRYKKILYVTVLEGLAKARYPKKGFRDRFIKLINNFSAWKNCEKISLPHLVAVLERSFDERLDSIQKFAFSEFVKWSSGGPIYLERDPEMSEIQKLWPKENGANIKLADLGISLQNLRHVELLYEYRNYLIHESRQRTMGFDRDYDKLPFYESFGEYDTLLGEW